MGLFTNGKEHPKGLRLIKMMTTKSSTDKEDPKGLRLIKIMSTTSSIGTPAGTSKDRTSS